MVYINKYIAFSQKIVEDAVEVENTLLPHEFCTCCKCIFSPNNVHVRSCERHLWNRALSGTEYKLVYTCTTLNAGEGRSRKESRTQRRLNWTHCVRVENETILPHLYKSHANVLQQSPLSSKDLLKGYFGPLRHQNSMHIRQLS